MMYNLRVNGIFAYGWNSGSLSSMIPRDLRKSLTKFSEHDGMRYLHLDRENILVTEKSH